MGFIMASTIEQGSAAIGPCPQMKFELPGAGSSVMNQNMMYWYDGEHYWWNFTGNVQLTDQKGVWANEGGDGVNDDFYKTFWSSVFAVGTYKGKRWFGWYYCGHAVTLTERASRSSSGNRTITMRALWRSPHSKSANSLSAT